MSNLRVTLDTNCIIDLEDGTTPGEFLSRLVSIRKQASVTICCPAISGAEPQKGGSLPRSFEEWMGRLKAVGLGDAEILLPLERSDMSFYNYCLYTGPELTALERRIHDILFPKIAFEPEQCRAVNNLSADDILDMKKWRNARCDVLALWCHIWHDADVFVSNDRCFHAKTKKPRLIALGAKSIVRPDELPATIPHWSQG